MGFTIFYLSLMVLIPLATLPLRAATALLGDVLAHDHRPARRRFLPVERRRVAGGGVGQRRLRAARWPGCWCATIFPAAVSSTRWWICRSRCRPPSPASSLTTIYAPNGWLGAPLDRSGHQGGVHAAGHHRRADLHRPAIRRAHAAAGDRGSGSEIEEAAASLGATRATVLRQGGAALPVSGVAHRLRPGLRAGASANTDRSCSSPGTCRCGPRSRRS